LAARPEAANLIGIFAALCNDTVEDVCRRFDGAQFSTFKEELAELAIAELAPITTEMQRLMDDPAYVESVLRDGAQRAEALAGPVVREAQKIVGFLTV
jgi:tryptophanyl-tRNA synthetase